MIRKLTLTIGLFISLTFSSSGNADSLFSMANQYYQEQNFNDAIEAYNEILRLNKVSARLYYNLGNSYFKAGQLAQSILYLEKALLLSPGDEDIVFNLQIANLRVVDKIENPPDTFVVKLWKDILLLNSVAGWGWISIFLIWVSFIVAVLFIYARKRGIKKLSFLSSLAFFVLSLIVVFIASSRSKLVTKNQHAIVMSSNSYVKSGPSEKGIDLFILHEGAKVKLIENVNNWNRIVVSDSKIGWIPAQDLAEI